MSRLIWVTPGGKLYPFEVLAPAVADAAQAARATAAFSMRPRRRPRGRWARLSLADAVISSDPHFNYQPSGGDSFIPPTKPRKRRASRHLSSSVRKLPTSHARPRLSMVNRLG